jgi:mRNA-degrading endonuclease RelE of RelBE toxin-antitoxin system
MVNIVFKDEALDDLEEMGGAILEKFDKHFDKLLSMPPGRHLKHGLPYCVDNVGQGRIIYTFDNDTLFIIRCFATHKDYEKWYKE